MRLLVTAVAALALLVAAPAAGAKTFSAQQGSVSATLTYANQGATNLTIARGGATLFSGVPKLKECGQPCGPSGFDNDPPLRVLDLDADGEPEVVYSAYTGGAHCCTGAQVYRLNAQGSGYESRERNFWDPGFQIRLFDGVPYFFTADDAFAYRFTAYAFSGLPLLILRYSHGR